MGYIYISNAHEEASSFDLQEPCFALSNMKLTILAL